MLTPPSNWWTPISPRGRISVHLDGTDAGTVIKKRGRGDVMHELSSRDLISELWETGANELDGGEEGRCFEVVWEGRGDAKVVWVWA